VGTDFQPSGIVGTAVKKIKVGILGGSGYGGSELLRILLFHPNVELNLVTANEHAGKTVASVHPNLNQLTDLKFIGNPGEEQLSQLDCVFLALPHGQAMEVVPGLPPHLKVIDLSGDYRLSDAAVFERYYERRHISFEWQQKFVYGLTEINRREITEAQRIANPGCFATALLLGLFPLVDSKSITGKIIVDAKTGSSGSGAKAAANTHHPKRTNSFYAYKSFTHQHLPEVMQVLTEAGLSDELVFQVHSAPMVRGIFASIYVSLASPKTAQQIRELFDQYYRGSFFVRLVDGSPDVNWVKTTNFADIGMAVNGTNAVIFTAIDNLVKGAAGQAVQNMNLMFGLEETTGLLLAGSNP